jgi:hypothetical protein
MSIPKVIHYCWFGGKEPPRAVKKCIKSWKKYCPDYQIVCWNEQNTDLSQNRYAREAFEAKKWAFLTDWLRLKVIYDQGGIYLDTDVELLRSLDPLLESEGFFGLDERKMVSTGLGFGAEKGNPVVKALLDDYEGIPFFKEEGQFDLTPCPDRNTALLHRMGLDPHKEDQVFMGVRFLPREYLCPIEYESGKSYFTENTYSIHHFAATWTSPAAKRTRFLKRILGIALFNKIKGKFFKNCDWLDW